MSEPVIIGNVTLLHGDCLAVMPTLAADSLDAIVTDPPYGLGFMNKRWDHGIPAAAYWADALRVAKPGAHLLAFGGSRTFHRLVCAIEDAGWEVRDVLMWVYGSGFPKSLDVSKALDKRAGADREPLGWYQRPDGQPRNVEQWQTVANADRNTYSPADQVATKRRSAPATPAARQWAGWGTALKPAYEPILLARKPLAGTVAGNVLAHGCGALNIDGCRVATDEMSAPSEPDPARKCDPNWRMTGGVTGGGANHALGRFPANLIHDGSPEVLALFPETTSGSLRAGFYKDAPVRQFNAYGKQYPHDSSQWQGDSGSAARFFYTAKASKQDRDEGCNDLESRMATRYGEMGQGPLPQRNHHPTVKPTALMRYLCRLITPPGGLILDPFMGSGSTGKAALLEGFRFTGIEQDPDYLAIAAARIRAAHEHPKQMTLLGDAPARPTARDTAPDCVYQSSLFDASA